MSDPQATSDQLRRAEAERLARLTDLNVEVVLAHLLALERDGVIELTEGAANG